MTDRARLRSSAEALLREIQHLSGTEILEVAAGEAIDGETAAWAARHLERCASCRAHLAEAQEFVAKAESARAADERPSARPASAVPDRGFRYELASILGQYAAVLQQLRPAPATRTRGAQRATRRFAPAKFLPPKFIDDPRLAPLGLESKVEVDLELDPSSGDATLELRFRPLKSERAFAATVTIAVDGQVLGAATVSYGRAVFEDLRLTAEDWDRIELTVLVAG